MTNPEPRVLLVTGPPGAGKTTVAHTLASRSDRAVHLESDFLFHAIAEGYIEPWLPEAHEQNGVVMQVVADAAASYAVAGYPTIVDGIFAPGWFLEPVRDALTAAGVEASLAILRPSHETASARRARREEHPVPREVVGALWNEFAALGPLEHHVFENEGDDVGATAQRIADAWARGRLIVRSAG
ncbi:MAG: AAA family ATPase [Actinomycetota bacterium]